MLFAPVLIDSASAVQNPNQATCSWQQQISQEVRSHQVQKILNVIQPTLSTDSKSMVFKDFPNSFNNYAKKVENDKFKIALSIDNYYQLMDGEVKRLTKTLEEIRANRKRQQEQFLTNTLMSSINQAAKQPKTATTMAPEIMHL